MIRDFTLLGFVEHLAVLGAEVVVAEHEALEHGAMIIEIEAKASVGEYQPQSGPFSAWEPLADSTKEDRVHQDFPADEPELRTGEMRDSITHVVQGRTAEVGSDSEILMWQELGTATMPPRSIIGGAAARKADEVADVIGGEVALVLMGGQALGIDLKRRITG